MTVDRIIKEEKALHDINRKASKYLHLAKSISLNICWVKVNELMDEINKHKKLRYLSNTLDHQTLK